MVIKVNDYEVKKDRLYMKSHEWAQEQDDGTWKMGISDYAQKMLREISYVQYEDADEDFDEGEVICVVEALKATGDIYAPFDCTLVENNESLEDSPEKVSESPYEDGFLIRIKPRSDDRSKLISPEEYAKVIEAELDEL
ncbi:MAG: glycine cleavage system protein GcvH [Candidatus Heimdallarchaeota archaeon]|nr:glycine cleavage system protein GcvH [Candidatus Heimdallarchaeota archaeon]